MENELGLSSALFSLCGRYRYGLFRVKGSPFSEAKALGFIMLNPSTADGEKDDPTIKRCMSFADSFGYQGILVANLYSYRATDPTDLWVELDPDWARSLRDQCKAAEIPFFMKQMSAASQRSMPEIPEDLQVRKFPK